MQHVAHQAFSLLATNAGIDSHSPSLLFRVVLGLVGHLYGPRMVLPW